MATTSNMRIAIIGGGMAGLGLALSLHARSIPCAVYEQAPETGRFSGAIMMAPNSLRVLDTLGIYERIKSKGWSFETVLSKDINGKDDAHLFLGSKQLFGYDALRIYRNVLITELQNVCRERGIEILYQRKFTRIISENNEGVTFEFSDGAQVTAPILIAADGIHSRIRQSLFPGVEPQYTGILAVCGAVKRSLLTIPEGMKIDGPISFAGHNGAFVIAPQDVDGSELLGGTQRSFPAHDRQGWDAIARDLPFLHQFLEEGIEQRPAIIQSAIRGITDESIYTWAFHMLPALPHWRSEGGRIILAGDAAHVIPPTTGQGANQAFEDGFSLAVLLAEKPEKTSLTTTVDFWKEMREERVKKLIELTSKLNNMRLSPEEQKKLQADQIWRSEDGETGEQWRWLYMPEIEKTIQAWVDKQNTL